MKILFDHNVTRKLRKALAGHEIRTAREMGWDRLSDAKLLDAARWAHFEVLITGDKGIPSQQTPDSGRIALIILGSTDWAVIEPRIQLVRAALSRCVSGGCEEVPF